MSLVAIRRDRWYYMRTAPIERTLIDTPLERAMVCEPHKLVCWINVQCSSIFQFGCGIPLQNPDTDEWHEEDASLSFALSDCDWWSDCYYQYPIDIFTPVAPGLAIEMGEASPAIQPKRRLSQIRIVRENSSEH